MRTLEVQTDDASFEIDSLTEQQQIRLTHALDEYLKSLEQGTVFEVDKVFRDEPVLFRALTIYLGKLRSLYGLPDADRQSDSTVPKTLGEFTLVREIGRGGMGVVYEAKQAGMDRRVALKLLPMAATLDERQVARFKNESRAAGALHHPHIVPVYSVGEAEGIHYYAMQLIDGESVDHGIDRQQPSDGNRSKHDGGNWIADDWRSIVRLAIDVAEALHAAHETGVVHRDIKPSNLIIDTDRKVWVTDFGLARSQSGLSLTRPGDVIGTMRYMSPEQASGQSACVDGRTDIYSLAVTVYEMLALRPAYSGDDGASILKAIDRDDVAPLGRICRSVPRDLATVIAKAMSKSRDQRYETSQEFSDDLRRVIVGEPTLARPPTAIDRITRFGSQHKHGALVSVAICALGFVGFAISTALIAAEKRVSDQHAQRAQQSEKLWRQAVDRLGSQMAEQLAEIPSAEPVRRRLLRATLGYYEKFATVAATDPELRHDLAITYGKIGTLQGELRSDQRAIEALDRSERLFAELASEQVNDSNTQFDWSISQNNLAESLHQVGRLEEAAKYFARAIKTQERLFEIDPDPKFQVQLSTTLNNIGLLLAGSGAIREAETSYQRSVELLRALEKSTDFESSEHQKQLAAVLANLSALFEKSQPIIAIQYAREALGIQTRSLERDPGDAKMATQVIVTLQTLGMSQSSNKNQRDAIGSYDRAIKIGEQLLARWPDQPIAAARRISPVQAPVVQMPPLSVTDRNGPSSSQNQSQNGVPSGEPIHPPSNSPSGARGVDARESLPSRENDPPGSVATASKQDASTVRSVDQRQSLADVQDQSETNIGGVIESIALRNSKSWNRQLPRTPRESADDQPWQIDRETLQELREINRNLDHPQPGIADQARLDWFSGPGGLIELESDGGALPIVDVAGMIVDIPLDVIFGSHRSLDLVAVANASTGEMAIRDAILAAIAGEQSDHAVPLNETAKGSLHPIAYSSVALIASTLVLASRRRQRNVLFKTRGGKQ